MWLLSFIIIKSSNWKPPQELDDDLLQIADNQTEREHEAFMKEKIDR